MSADKTTDGLI